MWTAHNMKAQQFLGYFITEIQHKTLPDILQFRFFVFKDNTSPKTLQSDAASNTLGIIEFKIPNETPSTALDAITYAKKHVTFNTPLHYHIHKWTHSKCLCK